MKAQASSVKAAPPIRILSILKFVFRPFPFLLPWILSVWFYRILLDTPQGQSLIERAISAPPRSSIIILVLTLTWLIVAFSVAITLAASRWKEGPPPPKTKNIGSILVAPIAVIEGFWACCIALALPFLFAQATNISSAWIITTTAVLMSTLIVLWLGFSRTKEFSKLKQFMAAVNQNRAKLAIVGFCLALFPLLIGALLTILKPMVLAEAGPLLISLFGFGTLATLFSTLFILLPLSLRRPSLGILIALLIVIWFMYKPNNLAFDNKLLRAEAKAAFQLNNSETDAECRPIPASLDGAIDDHILGAEANSSTDPFKPIYLVSAEGGGIRAAYWTAMNLAQLDILTNDQFAQSVASISGVSGGSLGIATWLAARERIDLSPQDRLKLVSEYLGSDFLSPILGGLLFLDVPRVLLGPLWPSNTRDQVFEKALAQHWQIVGATDFFYRPMLSLCMRSFINVPAIFFNATDVLTGEYVPLSPISMPLTANEIKVGIPEFESTSLAYATVAQMIHTSARFSYLSPALDVGFNSSNYFDYENFDTSLIDEERFEKGWILVDGGYFDNTGLVPTQAALDYINEELRAEAENENEELDEEEDEDNPAFRRASIIALHLSNDPDLSYNYRTWLPPSLNRPFSQFTSPIEALLATRTEHSRKTVEAIDSKSEQEGYIFSQFSLADALNFARTNAWPGTGASLLDSSGILPVGASDSDMLDAKLNHLQRRYARFVDVFNASRPVWEDAIRKSMPSYCDKYDPTLLVGPPLGWTLKWTDQYLMRCLVFREQLMHVGASPLVPPVNLEQ